MTALFASYLFIPLLTNIEDTPAIRKEWFVVKIKEAVEIELLRESAIDEYVAFDVLLTEDSPSQ